MAVSLFAALTLSAAVAQEPRPAEKQAPRPSETSSIQDLYTQHSFTLYHAQGEQNACGPGCSEWIAVEGSFSPGAAVRFSALVRSFKERASTIPVFFDSPGGLQGEAMVIGRILRKVGMTAGVAKTLPAACPAAGSDEACKAAKASGAPLKAEWQNLQAQCNSSCIFALIGATTRLVPPASYVAVHSSRRVCVLPGGKVTEELKGRCAVRSPDMTAATQRYIQEMGIDKGLLDIIAATPFESLHFLTRDELVGFGIDARASQEMPWAVVKPSTGAPYIMKTFTDAKGADGNDVRLSFVRLSCARGRIALSYGRGLPADDLGTGTQVTASFGNAMLGLSRTANVQRLPPDRSPVDLRGVLLPTNFDLSLRTNETMELRETRRQQGSPEQQRSVRLSTSGLPALFTVLQSQCSNSSTAI